MIGRGAFYDCRGLTSVTIPNSVRSIESVAFSGCSGLKDVVVPQYVLDRQIRNVFSSSYSSITNVAYSSVITNIGSYAFYGCSGLTSVTIPDSVTSIGDSAFYNCSGLASVTIPDSVTNIGASAFSGCGGLTSVTIPDSVMSIGDRAFYNCSGLTSVTIPDGVKTIGAEAFRSCSNLISVTIPNSVTNIEDRAFSGCSGLTSFIVSDGNVNYKSVDGLLLSKDGKTLIQGVNGNATIPDGVTNIGAESFYDCDGLASVTIPDSVTSIGYGAFSGCSGLKDVVVPQYVLDRQIRNVFSSSYSSITNVAYSSVITNIGSYAFYGCSGLTSVTIPDSVTSIGDSAFYNCSGLASVTIPDSVTNIGASAFSGCGGLTSVTIPQCVCANRLSSVFSSSYSHITNVVISDSVTNIGNYAFSGCSGITDVTIPDSVTSIGSSAFSGCSGITDVTIPNSVTNIGSGVFSGCSGLTSVTIPESVCANRLSSVFPSSYKAITNVIISEGVTSIGSDAFRGCSGLTSVTIPDSVTNIGWDAFYGCSELTSMCITDISKWCGISFDGHYANPLVYVHNLYLNGEKVTDLTVPDSVTSIGSYAFSGCSGLMSVTIPDSVTSIGICAFYGCSGLTSVTIPDGVTSIGSSAFWGCSGLTSVTIPDSVTNIGSYAFSGCSGLTNVTIPDGVTIIGSGAFWGCSGLTSVTISQGACDQRLSAVFPAVYQTISSVHISDSVTNIADYAFAGCTNLQTEVWGGYRVLDGWLIGYTDEAEETIPDADKLKGICSEALKGCTALKRLEFGDRARLVSIGAEALKGCTELKTLVLPPSLTRIGDEAFMGCSYLDNVIVPGRVKSIGNRAFKNCTGFTWAQVEHGVESIGEEAFYGCWRITEVDIPSSVSSIGANAFGGDSSITKIALRGDSRKVSEIFSTYAQITEATIKPGTGALVDGLFSGCWSLESVRFIGNCPALANDGQNLYENTPSGSWNGLVTYIDKDSTGWDGTPGSHSLPMKWPLYGSYRREIRYAENISTPYAVVFDANGGTPNIQNEEQISESLFVLPEAPTREGYVFMGWWTEKSGGVKVTDETVFIEGVYSHLYAHWLKPYRVFLDSNGGIVTEDYVSYTDQAVYGNLPEPSRTGYALVGWSIAGEIISPETPIATTVDHTLVAMWEANRYAISFNASGGTGTMDDQSLVYDVSAPLSANGFTMPGSLFRGWSAAAGGAVVYRDGAFVENLSATDGDVVTLYAVWQEKPAAVLACEDAFGGAGTVTLDEDDNIIVTLTSDASGTVEIPDNVGVVTIDLNGHNMVGDGGLGEAALPSGPAIRIVKGDGEGDNTAQDVARLAIVDTSEGEKGQIAGGGESAGIEVAEDAATGVKLDVEEGVGVFNGDGSEQPWWELCPIEATLVAGEYFKMSLSELGYNVPTDGKTPYTVKALGLPAGLKLVGNKAVKDKKGKITKKANVEWWIEGVPTTAVDFFTNPPYLVITANGETKTEALPVEVAAQEVVDLGELELGQTINTNGWLAGVGAGWTVSGLPTGLKYATKKVTKTTGSGKKKVTTTVAEAYAVYGKTTKAGLFTITAKQKVGGYYETLKYRVLVRPKAVDAMVFGEELTNITTMAYVPFEWDLTNDVAAVGGKVAKVAGLPAGLAFASATTYKDKKKTQVKQYGQTIVGTPTKPGTYVVTFTKNVTTGTGKNKKTVAKTAQILWTVTANDANLELGFNTAGGVIEGGTVGLKYGDLMAFSATDGATVTASGMPAGITLANLGDGSYAFRGFTTKAGTYLVAVKATLNGKTVTQRVALKVDALPAWAKGTFNGYVAGEDGATNGLSAVTVSSVGKISGKFYEGGTNWTFTAASYTGYDDAAPAYSVPVVAKYSYKEKEKVKVNGKWTTKTVTKSVARNFTLRVGQDALGGMATLEEVDGSTVEAWQNLWGQADYKALGKQLFSTKSGKKTLAYRTFTIKGTDDVGAEMGLTDAMSLSLKVTPAGVVTATMSFDTGTKSKGKAVIYKPTCATVVIPLSAADAEEFEGEVFLFFAPSPANGFPGFAGAAPL